MLWTILLVIVVLALLGGFWNYGPPGVGPRPLYHGYGFGWGGGAVGVIVLVVLILFLVRGA